MLSTIVFVPGAFVSLLVSWFWVKPHVLQLGHVKKLVGLRQQSLQAAAPRLCPLPLSPLPPANNGTVHPVKLVSKGDSTGTYAAFRRGRAMGIEHRC